MAGKDISEKKLLRYEDEFAIAANLSLFQNRPVIKPETLVMKETWSDYTDGIDAKEQDRDILAEATYVTDDNEMRIVILGIENQTEIDPRMILRVYGYDGAAYRNQL